MNSISAVGSDHRSWIVIAAKTVVVLQVLSIVFLLTSVWVTLAVAAAFVITFVTVRALAKASKQVDQILTDELS